MEHLADPHLSSQQRADSSQHCCSLRLLPPGLAQQGPLYYPQNAHTHSTYYFKEIILDIM